MEDSRHNEIQRVFDLGAELAKKGDLDGVGNTVAVKTQDKHASGTQAPQYQLQQKFCISSNVFMKL
jgi:hypothetical protein